MPNVYADIQRQVTNLRTQVSPGTGSDIVQVWRRPIAGAPVAGGAGVDKFGARLTRGTDGTRPDQMYLLAGTYYANQGAKKQAKDEQWEDQPVDVVPWVFIFGEGDSPDVRMADYLTIAPKYAPLQLLAGIGWQPSQSYAVGQYEQPATSAKIMANRLSYQCTTAGTTGASEPAWPTTLGATVTDGGVVWTAVAPLSIFQVTNPSAPSTFAVNRAVICEQVFS